MPVKDVMAIHPKAVEIFQFRPQWLADRQTDIAIPGVTSLAWQKKTNKTDFCSKVMQYRYVKRLLLQYVIDRLVLFVENELLNYMVHYELTC